MRKTWCRRRFLFPSSSAEAEKNESAEIKSAEAWLATVVTRLCINHLKWAPGCRGKSIFGVWLPEPVIAEYTANPRENVQQAESLSIAFFSSSWRRFHQRKARGLFAQGSLWLRVRRSRPHRAEKRAELSPTSKSRAPSYHTARPPAFQVGRRINSDGWWKAFLKATNEGDMEGPHGGLVRRCRLHHRRRRGNPCSSQAHCPEPNPSLDCLFA